MRRWPLAEALLALERRQVARDLEQFRHEQLLYAAGALKDRPKRPRSLEREDEAESDSNW